MGERERASPATAAEWVEWRNDNLALKFLAEAFYQNTNHIGGGAWRVVGARLG